MDFTEVYSKSGIDSLRLILLIFKLLGIAPFSLNIVILKTPKNSRIQRVLYFSTSKRGSIYNLLLILCLLPITFYLAPVIYHIDSPAQIDVVIGTSLFIAGNISVIIVLLIYIFRQGTIVSIAHRLVYMDKKLIGKLSNICFQSSISDFIHERFILLTFLISGMIAFVSQLTMPGDQPLFVISLIPNLFLYSSVIQYALILIYLQKQCQNLNKSLKLLENPIIKFQFDFNYVKTVPRYITMNNLYITREGHRVLNEISWKLSNFYGWTALIVITYSCVSLIDLMYYFIISIDTMELPSLFWLSVINGISWIVITIYPIFVLTSSVTGLITEVCF